VFHVFFNTPERPRSETTALALERLALSPMQQLLGFSVAPDQGVGGAIVRELPLGPDLKFGNDARGKRFPQFDPPLVK
jgi:hypothetical protein